MTDQRVPPQELEAEDALLGAALVSAAAADRVIEHCDPAWLYRESQADILHAVRSLRAEGVEADGIAVIGELERRGKLGAVGGRARIHELVALVPTTRNVPHYAGMVRDAWVKRQAIYRIGQLSELAWNGSGPEELTSAFELAALDVAHKAENGEAAAIWTGNDAADDLEARVANPVDEDATGVAPPFGFLLPFQAGRLYVLTGYSSDGKTTVALQALHRAAEAGARVAFVTLEMLKADLRDRLVSTFGVPYGQVRTGRISDAHQFAYQRALRFLRDSDIAFVDDARTGEAIARMQRVRRFDFLIVDHLHRLRSEAKTQGELRIEIERAVASMVDLALAAEVPILLLAQMHRPASRDDFPRPTMQSLRESAKIEQEAAMVCAVWRKRDEKGLRTTETDFLVLKNRFGPEGHEKLVFLPESVSFGELPE